MVAQLLEGKLVAAQILSDVGVRAAKLAELGCTPGLGTILVGSDGPSASYVKKKHETCESVGIKSFHIELDDSATLQDVLAAVEEFNKSDEVHGYIVQLPLPHGIDSAPVLAAIDPDKDADGLHPVNLGKLVLQQPAPLPCTPAGIVAMLDHYDLSLQDKHVVVVGRGPTLGRPLSLLLASRGIDAAVTVVHSRISDLARYTLQADVVVGAAGVPSIVTPDMVSPGAIVVSGGISWEGKKLLPDVDETVADVASWITPRLGGVGPTTVAMLCRNTVQMAENALL